ncbi:MAG TPA: hypothetical protein VIL35_08140 [Vicinamibacterales bacterium]
MTAPKLLPAVLGGLFIGVLSSLPIISVANACCCLWVVTGGVLAAWLMQQNHPRPVTLADGGLVGLLAGLVGAVVMIAISVPIALLTGGYEQMLEAMLQQEGLTPEMRDMLSQVDPAALMVAGMLMMSAASVVFSTLGGLLGAAIFRKKTPPPPYVPPYVPPGPAGQVPPPLPPTPPVTRPPDIVAGGTPPPPAPAPGAPAEPSPPPEPPSVPDGPSSESDGADLAPGPGRPKADEEDRG